jgi:hypothetical protein
LWPGSRDRLELGSSFPPGDLLLDRCLAANDNLIGGAGGGVLLLAGTGCTEIPPLLRRDLILLVRLEEGMPLGDVGRFLQITPS